MQEKPSVSTEGFLLPWSESAHIATAVSRVQPRFLLNNSALAASKRRFFKRRDEANPGNIESLQLLVVRQK